MTRRTASLAAALARSALVTTLAGALLACPKTTNGGRGKRVADVELLAPRWHQLRAPSLRSGPRPAGKVAWKVDLKGAISGAVAISQGRVLVATNAGPQSRVVALDQATGRELWSKPVAGGVTEHPAIAFNEVYVGADDGKLYCFALVTGEPCWTSDLGAPIKGAVFSWEDELVVGTTGKKLHAVLAETGKPKWTYDAGGAVSGAPLVRDGILYVGADDNRLHAVNPVTGRKMWAFETEGPVRAMPLLEQKSIYVIGSGPISALDAGTGVPQWSYPLTGTASGGAIKAQVLYVLHPTSGVHAIDLRTKKAKWVQSVGKSELVGAPAVVDGVLYATSRDGRLHAHDATTGKALWQVELGGAAVASPVVNAGLVFVGTSAGTMFALR